MLFPGSFQAAIHQRSKEEILQFVIRTNFPGSHLAGFPALCKQLYNRLEEHCNLSQESLFGKYTLGILSCLRLGYLDQVNLYCVLSTCGSRCQQHISLRKCSCLTKYVAGKASIKKSNGVSRQLCTASQLHPQWENSSIAEKNDFPGSHLEISPALSKNLKNTPRAHCTKCQKTYLVAVLWWY